MFEEKFWKEGKIVAGIDEAGRGALAGPVVVACVILPPFTLPFFKGDSKKLSPQRREKLFGEIINKALSVSIAFATPEEIDRFNIYYATRRAFIKSLENLSIKPDIIITDDMPLKGLNYIAFPKADEKVFSVACASVIAKVFRDKLMALYSKKFQDFSFKEHKGYPTKEHLEEIKKHGIIPIHRKSYSPVKKALLNKGKKLF